MRYFDIVLIRSKFWLRRNRFFLTKLNKAAYSARITFSRIVEIAVFVGNLWKITGHCLHRLPQRGASAIAVDTLILFQYQRRYFDIVLTDLECIHQIVLDVLVNRFASKFAESISCVSSNVSLTRDHADIENSLSQFIQF